jgi:hypothetical protein
MNATSAIPEQTSTSEQHVIPEAPQPRRRKPRGKIAELPKEKRDIVNRLMDDGATYRTIELEMANHGVDLNGENISNWSTSGYQQHLDRQQWLEEVNAMREGASDLLQNYDPLKTHQGVIQLAVSQIFKALKQEALTDDPQNYTRLLNALARLSREALVFTKYEDTRAQAKVEELQKLDPHRELAEKEREILLGGAERFFGFRPDKQIGPSLADFLAQQRAARNSETAAADPAAPKSEPPAQNSEREIPNTATPSEIQSESAESAEINEPATVQTPSSDSQNHPDARAVPETQPNATLTETCNKCGAAVPPLLPSGERRSTHCDACGSGLPDDPPPAAGVKSP